MHRHSQRSGRRRGGWRVYCGLLFLASSGLSNPLPASASDDALTIINDTWSHYRSVKTEREESEILIVRSPHAARYSRAEAEELLGDTKPGVVHKRAVRHTLYAADGLDKIHIVFSLPAEDAGLSMLVWRQAESARDSMWLFMPGYPTVRRIPVSSRQRLAGTDLLYEDVRELSGERTAGFSYATRPPETVDGHPCEVIVATPKSGTSSAYGSRTIWIGKELHIPLKVEFHAVNGKLWKVLYNTELHEVAPAVQRADLIEMRDLQADETTLLLVTKRAVGGDIPSQVFTEDYLAHPADD
ncbi:MAG TPA: outer membrane lipoprotein-sorting protein [Candidatus Acidoferrales bacterium]|nr:outer membrane lipoprotein-sorting protein [Candidatus Acidoferrales bacterium]